MNATLGHGDEMMSADLDTIRLDLPASHKYLTVLAACIAEMLEHIDQVPDTTKLVYSVQLAVHEACTNIIDHAYSAQAPGRIEIALAMQNLPRRFVAVLKDTGLPFDPTTIPDPNLLEGQERGYGLFLMREILDEIKYEALPDGNRWQLTKNL
jgi:serine/threonine-protein kinase RsbW